MKMSELALRWVVAQEGVACTIAGGSKDEQIKANGNAGK